MMINDYEMFTEEKPYTPYMIDITNPLEVLRITDQSRMMIRVTEKSYPADLEFKQIRDVLDVACGAGEWIQWLAIRYPHLRLTGFDISAPMLEQAKFGINARQINQITLKQMNLLEPFDLPAQSFDLVNVGHIFAIMSPQTWPSFLQECRRVLRPGGIIRLTEPECGPTNKFFLERYFSLFCQAFYKAGRSFSTSGLQIGTIAVLGRLLKQAGFISITQYPTMVDYSSGAEWHEPMRQNLSLLFKFFQQYIIDWQVATKEEIDALYEQAMIELTAPDLGAQLSFMTTCGKLPA